MRTAPPTASTITSNRLVVERFRQLGGVHDLVVGQPCGRGRGELAGPHRADDSRGAEPLRDAREARAKPPSAPWTSTRSPTARWATLASATLRHRRVGNDRDGERRVDVVSLRRHDERLRADVHRGVPARPGGRQRDHPLADAQAGHAVAERADGSGHLEPGDERRLRHSRPVLVQPLAEEDVDQPDRGVADVDRDLARPGRGVRQVDEREDGGVAELGGLNSLHGDHLRGFNAPRDALTRQRSANPHSTSPRALSSRYASTGSIDRRQDAPLRGSPGSGRVAGARTGRCPLRHAGARHRAGGAPPDRCAALLRQQGGAAARAGRAGLAPVERRVKTRSAIARPGADAVATAMVLSGRSRHCPSSATS